MRGRALEFESVLPGRLRSRLPFGRDNSIKTNVFETRGAESREHVKADVPGVLDYTMAERPPYADVSRPFGDCNEEVAS